MSKITKRKKLKKEENISDDEGQSKTCLVRNTYMYLCKKYLLTMAGFAL